MTAKKTAKPKTFWAVRTPECWGVGDSVRVFRSRPSHGYKSNDWRTQEDAAGGQMCVGSFEAIVGISPGYDVPVQIAFTARVVK